MYGWQARPCMNLHGMYRWFSVVPQGFVLPFSSFFLVIFEALCCDFHGGVLRMFSCEILVGCHVWGPCASLAGDFAPRIPLNRSRFGGFMSYSSSWPREPKSAFPLIVSVSGQFLWGRGCPGDNPAIPEVLLQSVGWFGRSGDGKLRVDPRPGFLGRAV
jgi:hypothetical protein